MSIRNWAAIATVQGRIGVESMRHRGTKYVSSFPYVEALLSVTVLIFSNFADTTRTALQTVTAGGAACRTLTANRPTGLESTQVLQQPAAIPGEERPV